FPQHASDATTRECSFSTFFGNDLPGIIRLAPALLSRRPAMHQRTIRKPVMLEGVGLHSGKPARITLHPAPVNSGIVFKPADLDEAIPAAPESVVDCH